jgi:hypothetical protein
MGSHPFRKKERLLCNQTIILKLGKLGAELGLPPPQFRANGTRRRLIRDVLIYGKEIEGKIGPIADNHTQRIDNNSVHSEWVKLERDPPQTPSDSIVAVEVLHVYLMQHVNYGIKYEKKHHKNGYTHRSEYNVVLQRVEGYARHINMYDPNVLIPEINQSLRDYKKSLHVDIVKVKRGRPLTKRRFEQRVCSILSEIFSLCWSPSQRVKYTARDQYYHLKRILYDTLTEHLETGIFGSSEVTDIKSLLYDMLPDTQSGLWTLFHIRGYMRNGYDQSLKWMPDPRFIRELETKRALCPSYENVRKVEGGGLGTNTMNHLFYNGDLAAEVPDGQKYLDEVQWVDSQLCMNIRPNYSDQLNLGSVMFITRQENVDYQDGVNIFMYGVERSPNHSVDTYLQTFTEDTNLAAVRRNQCRVDGAHLPRPSTSNVIGYGPPSEETTGERTLRLEQRGREALEEALEAWEEGAPERWEALEEARWEALRRQPETLAEAEAEIEAQEAQEADARIARRLRQREVRRQAMEEELGG